jgi:uncharacterized protein
MNYPELERQMIHFLQTKLPANMFYHHPGHTVDVINAAERIARAENVSEEDILLIKSAAALHDCGFTVGYRDHELNGCGIAREVLPGLGYPEDKIEFICTLIMATKVPQDPRSYQAEILCDADLDYLGRDDFDVISETLYHEFMSFGIVKDRIGWNLLQKSFFESHHYWTKTSHTTRVAEKAKHLQHIQFMIENPAE